jgi:hypothetical protein
MRDAGKNFRAAKELCKEVISNGVVHTAAALTEIKIAIMSC